MCENIKKHFFDLALIKPNCIKLTISCKYYGVFSYFCREIDCSF